MTNGGAFWDDLQSDLEDSSFRDEFSAASDEIAAGDSGLTHSERRSWMLHRRFNEVLNEESFAAWLPKLLGNLERVRDGVQGQPHVANIERWDQLVRTRDLDGLRDAMTGSDRRSVEMREVTPFRGLLPEEDRLEVLREVDRNPPS